MGKRITVADIKQRLIDDKRTISLLGYAGKMMDNSSNWKCNDCGHEWTASTNNVISKNSGCPPCGSIKSANSLRVTVETIKQRLIDGERTVSLVSYGNDLLDNSSLWKCNDCGHEWTASAGNVLQDHGCRPCAIIKNADKLRVTEETIKQRLIDGGRTELSLVSYGNDLLDNSSLWKCNNCGHEWSASANNVISKGSGCPPCIGAEKLTKEIIFTRLNTNNRTVSLIKYGKNSDDNSSKWKCHDCDHEWTATANNVLSGSGCPPCGAIKIADSLRLSEETIKQRLVEANRPITFISCGKNCDDNSSKWKCHDCDHEWTACYSSVLNTGSGCPHCNPRGFNNDKPGYVYLHTFNGFIKVGITNKLEQRRTKLDNQTIDGITYTIKSTMFWYFEDGSDAADLEATILKLKKFEKYSYTKLLESTFDGKTELFENDAHQKILDYIAENYDISYV